MITQDINWIPLIVLCIFVVILNYWVWFKPNSFLGYIRIAKHSQISRSPWMKDIWILIDNPHYIWLARIIFSILLGVLFLVIIVLVFHLL